MLANRAGEPESKLGEDCIAGLHERLPVNACGWTSVLHEESSERGGVEQTLVIARRFILFSM